MSVHIHLKWSIFCSTRKLMKDFLPLINVGVSSMLHRVWNISPLNRKSRILSTVYFILILLLKGTPSKLLRSGVSKKIYIERERNEAKKRQWSWTPHFWQQIAPEANRLRLWAIYNHYGKLVLFSTRNVNFTYCKWTTKSSTNRAVMTQPCCHCFWCYELTEI